jgi:hypothetical protein
MYSVIVFLTPFLVKTRSISNLFETLAVDRSGAYPQVAQQVAWGTCTTFVGLGLTFLCP